MEIHATDRQLFKFCRRQYKYSVRQRLVPKDEPRGALWFGLLVHLGLAEFYRGHDWQAVMTREIEKDLRRDIDSLDADQQTKVQQDADLTIDIVERYIKTYESGDLWEVVAIEEPIRTKIPGKRAWFVGTLDLLVRINGKLWVVDHKTTSQGYRDSESLEWDDQMTAYLWGVRQQYKETPMGAIYNMIRKSSPQPVRVLKSGLPSMDKSQDTTVELYKAKLEELHLDPEQYREVIDAIRQNTFFRREMIARSPYALNDFEKWLPFEYAEMSSKSTPMYPNQTRDCMWACPFKSLCRTESDGGDVQAVADMAFRVKTPNER